MKKRILSFVLALCVLAETITVAMATPEYLHEVNSGYPEEDVSTLSLNYSGRTEQLTLPGPGRSYTATVYLPYNYGSSELEIYNVVIMINGSETNHNPLGSDGVERRILDFLSYQGKVAPFLLVWIDGDASLYANCEYTLNVLLQFLQSDYPVHGSLMAPADESAKHYALIGLSYGADAVLTAMESGSSTQNFGYYGVISPQTALDADRAERIIQNWQLRNRTVKELFALCGTDASTGGDGSEPNESKAYNACISIMDSLQPIADSRDFWHVSDARYNHGSSLTTCAGLFRFLPDCFTTSAGTAKVDLSTLQLNDVDPNEYWWYSANCIYSVLSVYFQEYLGYSKADSDVLIAGYLGTAQMESGLDPSRVEGCPERFGFDPVITPQKWTLMQTPESRDDYFYSYLRRYPYEYSSSARSGLSGRTLTKSNPTGVFNTAGYVAYDPEIDNTYFFGGIGYMQWTASGAIKYLTFCKNANLDWYTTEANLIFQLVSNESGGDRSRIDKYLSFGTPSGDPRQAGSNMAATQGGAHPETRAGAAEVWYARITSDVNISYDPRSAMLPILRLREDHLSFDPVIGEDFGPFTSDFDYGRRIVKLAMEYDANPGQQIEIGTTRVNLNSVKLSDISEDNPWWYSANCAYSVCSVYFQEVLGFSKEDSDVMTAGYLGGIQSGGKLDPTRLEGCSGENFAFDPVYSPTKWNAMQTPESRDNFYYRYLKILAQQYGMATAAHSSLQGLTVPATAGADLRAGINGAGYVAYDSDIESSYFFGGIGYCQWTATTGVKFLQLCRKYDVDWFTPNGNLIFQFTTNEGGGDLTRINRYVASGVPHRDPYQAGVNFAAIQGGVGKAEQRGYLAQVWYDRINSQVNISDEDDPYPLLRVSEDHKHLEKIYGVDYGPMTTDFEYGRKILQISTAISNGENINTAFHDKYQYSPGDIIAYVSNSNTVSASYARAYDWSMADIYAGTWMGRDGNSYARFDSYQREAYEDKLLYSSILCKELGIASLGGTYDGKSPGGGDIIEIALAELGVSEEPPGSNNVIYNTWFYGEDKEGDEWAWCAVFISWCAWQAGLLAGDSESKAEIFPRTGSCGVALRWFTDTQQFDWCYGHEATQLGGSVYEAVPGDIIIFPKLEDREGHIALITDVGTDYIQVVSGNDGNKVSASTITKSHLQSQWYSNATIIHIEYIESKTVDFTQEADTLGVPAATLG